MTQDEKDRLAAEDAFAQRGLQLSEEQIFALNDYLTGLIRELSP